MRGFSRGTAAPRGRPLPFGGRSASPLSGGSMESCIGGARRGSSKYTSPNCPMGAIKGGVELPFYRTTHHLIFHNTTQESHNVTRREELHSYLSSLASSSVVQGLIWNCRGLKKKGVSTFLKILFLNINFILWDYKKL